MSEKEFNKLKQLYINLETGFISAEKLIEKAEKFGIQLTKYQIRKFYDDQIENQVFKKDYNKVICSFDDVGCLQADIVFLNRFSKFNKDAKEKSSFKYILNI